MRRVVYIALIFGLLLSRCAPNELPEDVIGDPVFYAEGTLNGEEFSLLAGPNNVEVVSSNDVSDNDLMSFNVLFSQLGCENCEELSIDLIGNTASDMAQIESLLPLGEYQPIEEFNSQFSGSYALSITSSQAISFQLIPESGNDGIFVQNSEPFQAQAGSYNYVYTIIDNFDLCFSTVAGYVEFNDTGAVEFPQVISGTDTMGDYIDLAAFDTGTISITPSSDESDTELLEVFGQRIYTSELPFAEEEILSIYVVSESEEQTFTAEYSFASGFSIDCFSSLSIEPISAPTPAVPLSVIVSYTNGEGVTHSMPIGIDDFFTVQDIIPFLDDPLGREAYTLSFTCGLSLANSEGSALQLEITEGIIPIVIE